MTKYFAAAATLVILFLVNWAILDKERHLTDGAVVYLELAPVDPRSLMQGDYMALRFTMADRIQQALREQNHATDAPLQPGDGFVVVQLDQDRIAHFNRLASGNAPLADGEVRLLYRSRNDRIKFATNAFFFQEGHAERYEPARYGQFRVNAKGEPLLVTMHDAKLDILGEAQF